MKKLSYLFIALFSLTLLTTSCREQKTTEHKVEDAFDEAGNAIEDSADEVENAADELENAIDS